MNTKERVLFCLENSKGEYIPGSSLAETLGVSRNAIWKAVRQLQEEGHEIDAMRMRGYRLSPQSSVLTRQSIGKYLKTAGITVTVYDELPSTNTVLKQFAEQGAPEGTVILAQRQTNGRGRLGRSFFSPADSGIYMSILLRPQIEARDALLITTCAAAATAQAIEKHTRKTCGIKWVNDIFCEERKVCGILTEASLDLENGGLDIVSLLVKSGLCSSRGDARRNVQQGGVEADGEKIGDIAKAFTADELRAGVVIKRGKKNYRKIVLS